MKRLHRFVSIVLGLAGALFVIACSEPASDMSSASTEPHRDSLVPDIAEAADVGLPPLRVSMAYGEARALLSAAGWVPRVNRECLTHLVGPDARDTCGARPQPRACRICADVPELQACSSDARCLMRFSHPQALHDLEIRAYGEIEYWADTGPEAGLQVTTWERVSTE